MTPLLQRTIDAMALGGLAARTQESYLCNVEQPAWHYRHMPDQLSDKQVQEYPLFLLRERHG